MSVIYVRGVEGRLAKTSPKGKTIPIDNYIPVVQDNRMDRMILKGDVEVKKPTGKARQNDTPPPPGGNAI